MFGQSFIRKTYNPLFLVLLIFLFHSIVNFIWLEHDNTDPSWDPVRQSIEGHNIVLMLERGEISPSILLAGRPYGTLHPFFVNFVSMPFYLLLGENYKTSCLSLLFFFGILIFSVYLIAEKFYGKKEGVLSAFLVSMYPAVFGLSRQYYFDLPLTAMVSLGVLSIIYAVEKRSFSSCILMGAVFLFGMLTKTPFVLFVIGPFVLLVSSVYLDKKESSSRFLFSLCAVLLISLFLFLIWLIPNKAAYNGTILTYFSYFLSGRTLHLLLTEKIIYYSLVLLSQASFPMFLVFLTGLGYWIMSKKRKSLVVLLLWILIPYIFLTLLVEEYRYIMPVLPAMAILSGSLVSPAERLFKKKVFWVWFMLFFFGISQFTVLSFGAPLETYLLFSSIAMPVNYLNVGMLPPQGSTWMEHDSPYYKNKTEYKLYYAGCAYPMIVVYPPNKDNWRAEEIIEKIDKIRKKETPILIVIPNYVNFNANTFDYYSVIKNKGMKVGWAGCESNSTYFSNADYIVTKTGYNGFNNFECSGEFAKSCRDSLAGWLRSDFLPGKFEKIISYDLPDGSEAELYAKKAPQ
jgi:4-amino-4-deoxy-L-arabinose transferase-like glycosyltransferase